MKRQFIFLMATLALASLSLGSPTQAQEKEKGESMPMEKSMDSSSSMAMMKDLGPADKNYDQRFLDAMMGHHVGALVMAQDALDKSKRPEIQKLSRDIIDAQKKEIGQMKTWRKAWYKTDTAVKTKGQGTSMSMMKDLGPADKDYDQRFLDAMTEHHEGALVMAQDALNKSKRPEIQKLSKNIIAAQKKEIGQMKTWRKAWVKK
jgi:uncharacterized protein (DUF305 family)